MLDIDVAIKHCEEVAEGLEKKANTYGIKQAYIPKSRELVDCISCAADHRQLAKWLTELKEAKRLLKAAVEDINYYVDCYEAHCDECCCNQDNHCHWKHEAAVLKLIGEDEDET